MAERPSIQEILKQARSGSVPASPTPAKASPPAEAGSLATTPTPAGAGSPGVPPVGRPLTAREKLAAARNQPATASITASPPNRVTDLTREVVEDVPRPEPAPGPKLPTPLAAESDVRIVADRDDSKTIARVARHASPAPAESPPAPTTRRGFTARAATIATAAVAVMAALGALLSRLGGSSRGSVKLAIGSPSDFPPGTVDDRWREAGFFVVRSPEGDGPDRIAAISSACTHLGCLPDWSHEEGRFHCPCHGSAFDREGRPLAGPAPRPLDRLSIQLNPEGQLVVNLGEHQQAEPGASEPPAGALDL